MIKDLMLQQRTFFETQQTKDIAYRKQALKRLEEEIVKREDAVCNALYADFKKPRFETLAAETQFVLAELRYALKKIDQWARPKRVRGSWMNWPSSNFIYKEPYGAVLIIAPWNYPFQLVVAPLIGAVAAGNTVVIKPSEMTPHTSALIKVLIGAVFDPAHVAVVEGGVAMSQQLLVEKWDYIFFTGSTCVGQIVYESAAKHLTPVTLELGGKNPCIVDETAAIDLAAKRIVWGKFLNAGQTCIATDYILVHEHVKAGLIDALKRHLIRCYGDDMEVSPDFARTVNKTHYQGLKTLLEGEDVIFGGHSNDDDFYLSPTLVNQPAMESKLMAGEIFGPILPIISYANESDIHDCIMRYGKPLATYVFSNDKKFQKKIIASYSFGGGAINDTVIQVTNKRLPFGGVGQSGLGAYHGKKTFDVFSHHKGIIKKANWFEAPVRYPPYKVPVKWVKKIKHLF